MRRTFRRLSDETGIPLVNISGGRLEEVPETGQAILGHWSGRFPQPLWSDPEAAFLHILRDPRDLLITGCHDHHIPPVEGSGYLARPRRDLGGVSYHEHLASLATAEDKLLFEMENRHADTLDEMMDWCAAPSRVITLRYEDLIADTDGYLIQAALSNFGLDPQIQRKGVDFFRELNPFAAVAGLSDAHVEGLLTRWPRELPRAVGEAYHLRYGDALRDLGFEKNGAWVKTLPAKASGPDFPRSARAEDGIAHAPESAELAHRLGFAPGPLLRMYGMRRSGNHAIASWLQRNAPDGRAVFLNNCKPGTDPLRSFRGIEMGDAHAQARKAQRDLASVTAEAGDGALLLISYEDAVPERDEGARRLSGPMDEALFTAEVAIYRGFLNWAASLLKKLQANDSFGLSYRAGVLLRSVDTYCRVLDRVAAADDRLVPICYDRWTEDDAYRARLLDRLGLELRDNGLGEVQGYGGGSSFQKDATRAEELQTANRWQQMSGDPEFQAVLHLAARDTALVDRLERHFPADAAILSRIHGQPPLPQEALA
ncbi:sulfotransferase [Mesobacterium pallidum]|uniref:sulfotransferase n=1 Tax=Mesobacterium pallidum TaxID=2872037 RepID=UPI001EE1E0BF|nr:sulfotransferase [Mesobacterium pallidum]